MRRAASPHRPQPSATPVGAVVIAASVPEAVPAADKQFTLEEAIALLKGSTSAQIAGYISLAVSIVTLYSILRLIGDDSASEPGSTCIGDFLASQKRYVACVH